MTILTNPGSRVATATVVVIAVVVVATAIIAESMWAGLLIVYGVLVGQFLGLSNVPSSDQIFFLAALFASLLVTFIGIKFRAKILGQVVAVIGLCGWAYCGIMGLGAGA